MKSKRKKNAASLIPVSGTSTAKVADIEHRPQQLGLRQDGLSLGNRVCGRMLAAGKMIVEQRLDLGYTKPLSFEVRDSSQLTQNKSPSCIVR
jgi:hypothetical protein